MAKARSPQHQMRKPPIPVHYFVGGNFLGTGYQELIFRGKKAHSKLTFWSPNSWLFVCEKCGEVWARGLSDHPYATHQALKGNCAQHGGGSLIALAGVFELENLPRTKTFLLHELNLWNSDPEAYATRDLISQTRLTN